MARARARARLGWPPGLPGSQAAGLPGSRCWPRCWPRRGTAHAPLIISRAALRPERAFCAPDCTTAKPWSSSWGGAGASTHDWMRGRFGALSAQNRHVHFKTDLRPPCQRLPSSHTAMATVSKVDPAHGSVAAESPSALKDAGNAALKAGDVKRATHMCARRRAGPRGPPRTPTRPGRAQLGRRHQLASRARSGSRAPSTSSRGAPTQMRSRRATPPLPPSVPPRAAPKSAATRRSDRAQVIPLPAALGRRRIGSVWTASQRACCTSCSRIVR